MVHVSLKSVYAASEAGLCMVNTASQDVKAARGSRPPPLGGGIESDTYAPAFRLGWRASFTGALPGAILAALQLEEI